MAESSYWTRFWRRRVTRRRLMAGAVLTGTGLAAAAVVGCGGGDGEVTGRTPGATLAGTPSPEQGLIDSRRNLDASNKLIQPATAGTTGGLLRFIGFDAVVLDRYDPHQTQFGPMYSNQSAVFSKLYMYKSHSEPTWENIVPDLAESAPEMVEPAPETVTYIIRLRRGVKFHDTDKIRSNFPSLAGRELTADDVIFSFERQRPESNPDSLQRPFYYRRSQYETIDSITKIDDYTIRIITKGPMVPFFHFLTDTNAMIIPKEIVDLEPGPEGKPWDSVDSFQGRGPGLEERMIGTGPFFWDKLTWGIEFQAARNPEWFGWDEPELGRPYLDGYVVSGQGLDDSTLEALFRAKKIDVAGFIDNPGWVFAIKEEMPELTLFMGHTSGWINSRLKTYCKPLDDWRVRRALHLATERRQVVDIIGSGQWKLQAPVGGAIQFWTLPEEELLTIPGYRQSTAEREQDIAEARRLWEAAGNPELPLIWNADQPAYIPRFMGAYAETLKNNLGIEIRTQTQPYARIAQGLLQGCEAVAMSWGFDNGWIDLDDWVFPYFRSGGPKNSFQEPEANLRGDIFDAELDSLLDAQRREFDIERRKDLGFQIQRYLLGLDPAGSGRPLEGLENRPAVHARLDYAAPAGPSVSWPYFKNRTSFPWFGNNYWIANVWFDSSDPSFQGRQA